MQILRVHNRYQQRGGEDVSFEAEADLLASRGHQVERLEFTNDEIAERPSPMDAARLAIMTVWSKPAQRRISECIDRVQPDIVHFDNTFPMVSPSAYSAVRRANVAIVQTLHNYRLFCPSATFFRDGHVCEDCLGKTPPWPGVVHACYRESRAQTAVVASMLTVHRLRRTWQREVDRYVSPSSFARNKFVEGGLPSERVVVKPHFLKSDPLGGETHREGFVFAGRLADYKGIELFPEAWQHLESDTPLRIMGDGPRVTLIEEFAAQHTHVDYLGRQVKDRVLEEIRSANALLVPSLLYETFGLTIIEAFACGTPVIASKLGAMAELVEDGITGLLFEPGNAEDLAAKVCWAAEHPEEMRRMGENGRREYEEKYTPERNYEMLMDIYRQAIAHARSRRS